MKSSSSSFALARALCLALLLALAPPSCRAVIDLDGAGDVGELLEFFDRDDDLPPPPKGRGGARPPGQTVKVHVDDGPKTCEDGPTKVAKGDKLSVHYTGFIDESSATGVPGKKFDSSRDRGETLDFLVGNRDRGIVQGLDEGVVGLCLGAKATLVVPPSLGYHDKGSGPNIPGGATLRFEVEVVRIEEDNLFAEIDTDRDGRLDEAELLAYFRTMDRDEVPEELWKQEDKNGDRFVSWEEFGGPKGTKPPVTRGPMKEEL